MAKTISSKADTQIFIDAQFIQSRLRKEQCSSLSTRFAETPNQIQVKTDTNSEFRVALDNVEKPTELIIEVDYKVQLSSVDPEKSLATYEATHIAQFSILGWGGFTDWVNLPTEKLSAAFAVIHNIALMRAENTLVAMGLRGALPRQASFDGPLTKKSERPAQTPAAAKPA